MNKIAILLPFSLLAACASVTPHYDARFGDTVRTARQSQTAKAEVPNSPDLVQGLDAKAAVNALDRYQDSFKSPPKTFEVINIGGALSGN